ncbi:hypothetical protein [Azospirillum sp. B2RO_4]|uniref:hypothetical protein n=1 Tax=Azospirillum sp. B2RO_4 TaxID=3027796 RepID=UPI003DA95C43
MARIVHMGKLGGYAALLDGALLELDSRILWPSVPALTEALRQAGITPSDLILDTRSPAGIMPAAAVSAPAAASHRNGGLPLAA